jgi:hypothetical protein
MRPIPPINRGVGVGFSSLLTELLTALQLSHSEQTLLA